LTAERLDRAGLLVLTAPGRRFSDDEIALVRRFVEQGGTLICMVGAEEARASATLLEEFQFKVAPSPVGPGENIREPDPLGAFAVSYGRANEPKIVVQFYAAWPLEILTNYYTYIREMIDGQEVPVVARVQIGQGRVMVIADTNFAINRNLESITNQYPSHINFWRVLLSENFGNEAPNLPIEPLQEKGIMEKDDAIPEQGPQ